MGFITLETLHLKAKELPALSSAATVLLSLVEDPEVTREEISYLVSVDPVLCANAFKYANSAAIGARRKIESVSEIVDYLGINTLKQIAMFVAAKSFMTDPALWFESVFIANTAKKIANKLSEDSRNQDLIYMAALFMAYGALVFETHYTKQYNEVKQEKNFYKRLKLEKEAFHFNHIEASAAVLPQLELPRSVIEIIETQSDLQANTFTKANLIIELARALLSMKGMSDSDIEAYLENHELTPLLNQFNIATGWLNAEFVTKLFEEANELTSI